MIAPLIGDGTIVLRRVRKAVPEFVGSLPSASLTSGTIMSDHSPLHVRPAAGGKEYIRITPQTARWEHLNFAVRLLHRGDEWKADTEDFEYGFVILGGTCSVTTSQGRWLKVGRRPNVFAGMPYGFFLPPHT